MRAPKVNINVGSMVAMDFALRTLARELPAQYDPRLFRVEVTDQSDVDRGKLAITLAFYIPDLKLPRPKLHHETYHSEEISWE